MVMLVKGMMKRPCATDSIGEILAKWPAAARLLTRHRMHCVGCEIARFETLEAACGVYGVDLETLLREIETAVIC
jgi:hybrid cluster-associated redox disulfide protein